MNLQEMCKAIGLDEKGKSEASKRKKRGMT